MCLASHSPKWAHIACSPSHCDFRPSPTPLALSITPTFSNSMTLCYADCPLRIAHCLMICDVDARFQPNVVCLMQPIRLHSGRTPRCLRSLNVAILQGCGDNCQAPVPTSARREELRHFGTQWPKPCVQRPRWSTRDGVNGEAALLPAGDLIAQKIQAWGYPLVRPQTGSILTPNPFNQYHLHVFSQ